MKLTLPLEGVDDLIRAMVHRVVEHGHDPSTLRLGPWILALSVYRDPFPTHRRGPELGCLWHLQTKSFEKRESESPSPNDALYDLVQRVAMFAAQSPILGVRLKTPGPPVPCDLTPDRPPQAHHQWAWWDE